MAISINILFLFTSLLVQIAQAQSPVRTQLQWLDSPEEPVELNWPNSVEWVWKDPTHPQAQVWIEVPEHLSLAIEDAPYARLLQTDTQRETEPRKILIVEMTEAKRIVPLLKMDSEGGIHKIGLSVKLDTNEPQILLHESCVQEGIVIDPLPAERNHFLFLAASCKKAKQSLEVVLNSSDEGHLALRGSFPWSLLDAHSSIRLSIPLTRWRNLKSDTPFAYALLSNPLQSAELASFQVRYRKNSSSSAVHSLPAPRKIPPSSPQPAAPSNRFSTFNLDLGLAHQDYTLPGQDFHPSQYSLEIALRTEHTLPFETFSSLQLEVGFPLLPLLPQFLQMPSSGFYFAALRAPIQFRGGEKPASSARFSPGLKAGILQLRDRTLASSFYWGPEFQFEWKGRWPLLQNRAYAILIGFTPLANASSATSLNSCGLSTQLTLEMAPNQEKWDFLIKIDYYKLNLLDPFASDWIRSSLGVRAWL